jgi:hypothetical protein
MSTAKKAPVRQFIGRIPISLHTRVTTAANAKDLKLVAVLRQALELWLERNAA